MKINRILELLKMLLLISESVSAAIAESSIPKAQQKEIEKEIEIANSRLQLAKVNVFVEPEEFSE